MAGYPLLPLHPGFRGPSGEQGQILLDGIVVRVTLFAGKSDDEADWHIYIRTDNPNVQQTLGPHLRANGVAVDDLDLCRFYCELMVTDRHRNPPFDEFFDSADFTKPFRLSKPGSARPAWDLGLIAGNNQGETQDFSCNSKLFRDGGRAYLQGPFVNDEAHGTLLEIHPLDSIAFAMDATGKTIAGKKGDADWPKRKITWRVAWFGNSSFHRINGESYMKQERTTTWFLELPGEADDSPTFPGHHPPGSILFPSLETKPIELWDGRDNVMYNSRGVESIDEAEFAVDPRDGRSKLKVSATMKVPNTRGGIIVREYVVEFKPPVNA